MSNNDFNPLACIVFVVGGGLGVAIILAILSPLIFYLEYQGAFKYAESQDIPSKIHKCETDSFERKACVVIEKEEGFDSQDYYWIVKDEVTGKWRIREGQ